MLERHPFSCLEAHISNDAQYSLTKFPASPEGAPIKNTDAGYSSSREGTSMMSIVSNTAMLHSSNLSDLKISKRMVKTETLQWDMKLGFMKLAFFLLSWTSKFAKDESHHH